jgi:hypothetical protein
LAAKVVADDVQHPRQQAKPGLPALQERATLLVLEQAEVLSAAWAQ